MINTLSKSDYSFYYQASVWEKYEDFIYAISRGRSDEALKIFKEESMDVNEEVRPVRRSFSYFNGVDWRYCPSHLC